MKEPSLTISEAAQILHWIGWPDFGGANARNNLNHVRNELYKRIRTGVLYVTKGPYPREIYFIPFKYLLRIALTDYRAALIRLAARDYGYRLSTIYQHPAENLHYEEGEGDIVEEEEEEEEEYEAEECDEGEHTET